MAEFEAIGKALQIPQSVLNNIDKIDQKINQIATDSDKMAKMFTSAMTRMGNGADGLLQKLQNMQTTINKLDISKFAQSVQNVGRGTTQVEQFAASIAKAAEAINRYNRENRERANVDNSKQLAQLNKEIEAMRKRTQQLEEYINKQRQANQGTGRRSGSSSTTTNADTKALNAYNRAMAASEALVTQRINKLAKLRQAEEMLRNASGNYATQLNRISQEIARINKLNEGLVDRQGRVIRSQHNLMNTSQQLARQLALVFSVSAIQGYINKLVEVRGEFELQQTALASILQNKDEADALFGQITELAVRSPFTIKELTTYSKSLAAYQVQYEDLYDTLKMLADVSSGLGVDMQRLILAFGQVKAANFLRGTETRQFTEAGINMLGELSKYYSELEGRIVSVTEVQDRQFKRMISFQDVEEVFKRLTSAGGMFYNMQEKQSETLRGIVMNFQDQIDLMLNDIGKENQGIIVNVINFAKSLLENWRTIAQVMEPIASILVLYLTLTKSWAALSGNIPKLWLNIGVALEQVKLSLTAAGRAQRGFNEAAATNAWLAIGAVVATIIWEVVNAIKAANAEQEELNKTLSEGYDNAVTMAANYKRLANIISDTTASYEEQKSALGELKRTYGEILPQHYLEAEAIRSMKGNYDEATSAIYNYIQAKTQEKQLQVIASNEGADLSDTQQDLAKEMQLLAKSTNHYNMSLNEANSIINKIGEDIKKGLVKSSDDAVNRFKELYKISTGVELPSGLAPSELRDYYEAFVELEKKKDEVLSQSNTAFADSITRDLQEQLKVIDGTIKQMRSLLNTISHAGEVGEDGALITQTQIDDAKKKLIELTSSWGIEASKIQELTGSAFEIKQTTVELTKAAYQSLINELSKTRFEPGKQASVNKFIEDLQMKINSLDATPFEDYVSDIVKASAVANSISLDGVIDVFARAGESVEDYRKRLKGIIDQLQSDLADYAKSPYLVAMWTDNPQAAADAQRKLAVAQAAYSAVNVDKTTSGSKKNPELEKLKEQISLIEKAAKEYEDYRKLFDEQTAQQKTEDAFKQAFENLGLDISMDFDASGVIEALRNLFNTAGEEGNQILTEKIATRKTDVEITERTTDLEEYRKKIDELFQSLSNYQELEKLGLNKDLISRIFGINTSSIQDVQDAFDKMKDVLKGYGKEGEKLIADSEKKITDAQQKELKDRLAQYAEFMRNSISERAKIEIEAQKEIAKIQATQGMTQPMKDASIQNVRQRANEQISKLDWQDFQNSDVYTQLFQDLEYVSTSALKRIKANLDALKDSMSNLTPEQLKSINEYYSKLDEQLSTRNPFAAMRDSLKEIKALQAEGRTEEVINNELLMYDQQAQTLKTQISDLETIIGMKQEGMSLDSLNDDVLQRNADILGKSTDELRMQLSLRKGQLNQVQTNIGISNKDLQSYAKARKDLKGLSDEIDIIRSLGKTTFGSIMDILDSMGVETDNTAGTLVEMGASLVDLAAQAVLFGIQLQLNTVLAEAMGVAINAALGPIGWAVIALQALTSIFTAFSKIHDNKREKQIEKEQEAVDYLEKSYDKLYDTIENGLSIYSYSDNAKLIANLRKQVESYQRMIALEEDKKKTDEDRIKDWKDDIDDLYSQIEDLYNNIRENLISSFKDVSSQLAESLVDAFESGEDAAEAWADSVRDIMVDILTNIMTMKYIEPAVQSIWDNLYEQMMPKTSYAEELTDKRNELQNELDKLEAEGNPYRRFSKEWYDWINEYNKVAGSLQKIEEEYDKANQAAEGEIPNITEDIVNSTVGQLNDLLNSVVDSPLAEIIKQLYGQSGAAGDTLSTLEKGIQGVTEQTAEVLASIVESIRFFVSDENTVIHNIYNTLVMPTEENPFLSELRLQTEQLRLLYNLWNGVIKNQSGSGRAVNVRIV